MGMNSLNQTSTQSAPPQQPDVNKQNNNKVSDKQADDFSERMAKDKADKTAKKKLTAEKEPSLESLLAERNKASKEGTDEEHMSHAMRDISEMASQNVAHQLKADLRASEIQRINNIQDVDAALQTVVDQIRVSAKDAVNGAEVRLTLKDNVLPGTEIRIQRSGAELTVTMNTTSAEAGNFLAQHEANLQKMLAERFANDRVQVNINMSGSDSQDSDGRSRNQYVSDDDSQNSSNNDRA